MELLLVWGLGFWGVCKSGFSSFRLKALALDVKISCSGLGG